MEKFVVRPEIVTDEMLEYLDRLRKSGVTNMFGAGSYLRDEFGMSKNDSHKVLGYWMDTFGQEKR